MRFASMAIETTRGAPAQHFAVDSTRLTVNDFGPEGDLVSGLF